MKAAVLIGILLGGATGTAQTIVVDRFNDGSIGNGTNPAETDIAWFGMDNQSIPAVNTVDQPMGIDHGNVLTFSPVANNRSMHGYFSGQRLNSPGDFIRLSLDYKYDSAAFSQGVRFGLVNSNGSIATTGSTAGTLDGDTGYGFSLNPGAYATNNEIFRYDMVGASASYTRVGTPAFSTADPDDAVHELLFTITRNAAGDLDITAEMDGVFSTVTRSALAGSSPNYYFDQIYLRLSGSGNQGPVYLDNITVTTNVPEPAYAAAVLVIAPWLISRRRRYTH